MLLRIIWLDSVEGDHAAWKALLHLTAKQGNQFACRHLLDHKEVEPMEETLPLLEELELVPCENVHSSDSPSDYGGGF